MFSVSSTGKLSKGFPIAPRFNIGEEISSGESRSGESERPDEEDPSRNTARDRRVVFVSLSGGGRTISKDKGCDSGELFDTIAHADNAMFDAFNKHNVDSELLNFLSVR